MLSVSQQKGSVMAKSKTKNSMTIDAHRLRGMIHGAG